jgi:hypothetical protein
LLVVADESLVDAVCLSLRLSFAVTIALANRTASGAGVRAKPDPGNLPEIYYQLKTVKEVCGKAVVTIIKGSNFYNSKTLFLGFG